MKVAILDDTFDTLRTLPCFGRLGEHEVAVYRDHVDDVDVLAGRLHACEALVLIRERTAIRAPLLERLPELRLISRRSGYPHIDVEKCTRLGIVVPSSQHPATPSYAAAELTWGLILAAMRRIPHEMAALQAGLWQTGLAARCAERPSASTATAGSAASSRATAGRSAWRSRCGGASHRWLAPAPTA